MSTTKYIRPMGFGEFFRVSLNLFVRTIWPLWMIYLLIVFTFNPVFRWFFINFVPTEWQRVAWDLHVFAFILLPAFFIGPAMLTISNVILERPKKTVANFRLGMSLSMIFKILMFYSPVLILIPLLRYSIRASSGMLFLLFTIPLLFFTPIWVFYPIALLLEKKNVVDSVRRIRTFVSGQFKRLLQIQLLLILFIALITPFALYYAEYYSMTVDKISYLEFISSATSKALFGALADFLSDALFLAMPLPLGFAITMYVLHYYQVRAVKENYSEELLAQELGYQPIEEMMTV